jgi:hypothetical protein
MSVRIDELFENLPPVLTVNDLTRILGKDCITRTPPYRAPDCRKARHLST